MPIMRYVAILSELVNIPNAWTNAQTMRKLGSGLRNKSNGESKDSTSDDDKRQDVIEPELYYLIARFLSQGPCKEIGSVSI